MKYPEINRKLNVLREYLGDLRPYVTLDTDFILNNKEKIFSMERLFQLAVDEAADINSFVAYQISNTVPESYRSSFQSLVTAQIFDQEFTDRISESAKIRNQIIHDYEKIQKRDTIEAIKTFFPLYENYLAQLIEKLN